MMKMLDWRKEIEARLAYLNLDPMREAEIVEELSQHLEFRYAELLTGGAKEEDAMRATLADLSDTKAFRRELRRVETLLKAEPLIPGGAGRSMLGNVICDLRYALRMMRKQPGFAAIAVLTLALGIGSNTAIFSVLHAVVLRPLPFPEADRLVMVSETEKGGEPGHMGYPTFADWRARSTSIEAISALSDWNPTLTGVGEPEGLAGASVTADFFRVLGVRPMLGRDFTDQDDRPNTQRIAIISYGLWQRSFNGDPSVLGRPIFLSGVERTVIGVMPPDFQPILTSSNRRVDIWRPLGYAGEVPPACRTCRHLRAVARIRSDVSREQAASDLAAVQQTIEREHPSDYSSSGVALKPLREQFVGSAGSVLFFLFGAVGLVLLIACANVANLMLSHTASRRREMAVRSALGASRVRIVSQLLTESMILALVGGALGILLAFYGTEWLISLAPGNIPRIEQVRLSPVVLAFAAGASALTSILFGSVPALTASRTDLHRDLKEGGRGQLGTAHRGLRDALVIADVALAMVLLTGAGLMLKSMARLLEVPSGMQTENALTMRLSLFGPEFAGKEGDARVLTTFRQVSEKIYSIPGVKSAGLVSQLPLSGDFDMSSVEFKDKPIANPADAPGAFRYGITPGYIEAMGIPLLRGRSITEQDDARAQPVVLINQLLAETIWPDMDPTGKFVQIFGRDTPWRRVVGVVGNVRHEGLDEPEKMELYVPEAQMPFSESDMILAVRTESEPAALAGPAREAIWSVMRNIRITDVAPMDQVIAASVSQRRFPMMLLGLFAAAALTLATVGLYGVISYAVTQRTAEIGVRMALGAQPGQVLRMVFVHGMSLVGFGLVVGLGSSFALGGFIAALLFGVTPFDVATLASVAMLLTVVGGLACWIPARRAALLDPLGALRHE